jgi:pyruvate/2-oxoglutarate dehydrogenase complex dihydrolipoamide dehydrogenase (E3) component
MTARSTPDKLWYLRRLNLFEGMSAEELERGAVGLEPAQVFARFGVAVTVVEALPRLLPMEEPEAGDLVAEIFRREGIVVRTGAKVSSAARNGDGIGGR